MNNFGHSSNTTLFLLIALFAHFGQELSCVLANTAPGISQVPQQLIQINATNGPVPFVVWDAESAADALTVSATSSNLALVPLANIAFGGGGSNRTVTVWPVPQRAGKSLITLEVSDGAATNNTAFLLTVNSPPQFQANNPLTVDQGGSGTVTSDLLRAVDAESGPGGVIFTVAPNGMGAAPHYGWLRLNGTNLVAGNQFTQQDINQGRLTYQNDGGCGPIDNFQFNITDVDGGLQATGAYSFVIEVTLQDQPPLALDGAAQLSIGATYTGSLSATNPDCLPQPLTFRILTNGTHGTLTITDTATGAFVYHANPGETGQDQVVFQVSDGVQDAPRPGVFAFTMSNTPPTANSATWEAQENSSLFGTLTASDPDLPAQPITFTVVSTPSKGSVSVTNAADGSFVYTPKPGRFGSDTFTFRVNDGSVDSPPAQATILVRPAFRPGRLLVTDQGSQSTGSLVLVDPGTKDMLPVAQGGHVRSPFGVAVEPTGSVLLTDNNGGLCRIDPVTGAQSLVVTNSVLPAPLNLAIEASGNILVTDMGLGLLRFSPQGVLLTTFPRGSLEFASGVAVAANGDIFVNDAAAVAGNPAGTEVLRVDPQTLVQTTIATNNLLHVPVGLAMESSGGLLLTDVGSFLGGLDSIVRLDPSTGSQTLVTSSNFLNASLGLAVEQTGTIFVACGDGSIVEVDPATGAQAQAIPPGLLSKLNGIAVVPGPMARPEILALEKSADGCLIRAAGLPGRKYELLRSTAVSGGGWIAVDTQQASLEGMVQLSDGTQLETGAFYRLRMR